MPRIPKGSFEGKKFLVTGHTGFKGSWLSLWLKKLGANVIGYSLPSKTDPNLFSLTDLKDHVEHIEGDVRDLAHLNDVIQANSPDAVFHLAAQSLVLEGYEEPQQTFATNALGTVNLLEACRHSSAIRAILIVTTDKCYENRSWLWGYRENDRLGGRDPYSASKTMAEIAACAYHASFLKGKIPTATVRCGNVIGGGDFASNRLMPDCFRSLMNRQPVPIRNPHSIRPWLHVLDSLYGYLKLADKLLNEGEEFSGAWNFGPHENNAITVREMVDYAIEAWGGGDWIENDPKDAPEEMKILKLNWEKASKLLDWAPHYCWNKAIEETVSWFKDYDASSNMFETCMQQIDKYENENYPVKRGLSH